jgi:hypothetical protein
MRMGIKWSTRIGSVGKSQRKLVDEEELEVGL